MSVSLVCPSCQYENKSPGVFCGKCGARMGIENAPSLAQQKDPLRAMRTFVTVIKSLISLLLAVVIALLLWPIKPTPIDPYDDYAKIFSSQLDKLLDTAVKQGESVTVILEQDLNNYLAWRQRETSAAVEGTGYRMDITQTYIAFHSNTIEVNVVASLGPLRISHMVRGTPVCEPGKPFRIAVESSKIGHMAMPSALSSVVAGKIEGALSTLTRDKMILDHAKLVSVIEGKARIVVGK